MFDPDKTYGTLVWDMTVAVWDDDADDYVRSFNASSAFGNRKNFIFRP